MSDKASLKDRLLSSVDVASPEEAQSFFRQKGNDFKFGETVFGDQFQTFSKPKVLINEKKFKQEGASGDFRNKAILGESIHNLKFIEPQRYQRLKNAALSSIPYRFNAIQAFETDVKAGRVKLDVPFDEFKRQTERFGTTITDSAIFKAWHDESRFDQVIGGFLQAQDPDIPTMKNFSRDAKFFGGPLKMELNKLATDLDLQ